MAPSRGAQGLIVVSLLGVIGVAALYGRWAWEDSGSFVVVLFGIPMVCAAFSLWVERASRTKLAPAVIATLAVVSLAWSLVTALGIGLLFLVPSLLLLVAAAVSFSHRVGRATSAPLRN